MSLRRALRASAVALWALAGWLAVAQAGVPFGIGQGQQGAAAGTAFSPASLSAAVAWWDGSTFTTDGSTKDGSNNVTRWEDKIGSYDLTVVNATPLWVDNAVNGLDAVDFEAGDVDHLAVDSAPPSKPFVFYVVAQLESTGAAVMAYAGDKDVNNQHLDELMCTTGPIGRVDSFDTSVSGSNHGTTLSTATTYLFKGAFLASNSRTINVDDLTPVNGTASKVVSGPDRVALGGRFDSTPASAQAWDGYICEAVLTNADLSGADEELLETYLDGKWAIPGITSAPPVSGPRFPPLPPIFFGAGCACALLAMRRPRAPRRGDVLKFPVPASARRVA